MLDAAALRRLSKQVFVPLPGLDARDGQIKRLFDKHNRAMILTSSTPLTPNSNASSIGDSSLLDDSNIDDSNNIGLLSQSELHSIGELTEGWNGSGLKYLSCSKVVDPSYEEEAIKQYGGIECIPNTAAFRSIQYSDFVEALKEVHPSSKLLLTWKRQLK